MRKLILLMVALLAMPLVFCQDLELVNSIGTMYSLGSNINGYITIPASDIIKVDVSLVIPLGYSIESWSAQGNSTLISFESFNTSYMDQTSTFGHWNFSGPINSDFIISYEIKPNSAGDKNITLLWVTPAGFGKVEDRVLISSASGSVKGGGVSVKCFDFICNATAGESIKNCPVDCLLSSVKGINLVTALIITTILAVTLALIIVELIKHRKMNKSVEKVHHEVSIPEARKEGLHEKVAEKRVAMRKTEHLAKKKVKVVRSKPQKKVVLKPSMRARKVTKVKKSYSNTIRQLESIRKSLE